MKKLSLILAALAFATSAAAQDFTVGSLTISDPHAAPTTPSQMSDAGFMTITNAGDAPDDLIGVSGDFADLMLHVTAVDANGIATMTHVESLEIPAHGKVELKHGGYHIMMMGLKKPLTKGEMVPATLTFKNAGNVKIEFMIGDGGMDMQSGDATMGGMKMDSADADAIAATIKGQFDTPDAPLTVANVSVQGSAAVAGWSQGGMGGRAFLTKGAKGWSITLCSGESLTQAATLKSLGLSAADADALAMSVAAADATLPPATVALLNSFAGTVQMDGAGN